MVGVVSAIVGKPPKQDTSALEAQKKTLADQEAKTKAEESRLKAQGNKKLELSRKRRMASASLLTGSETGTRPTTLG